MNAPEDGERLHALDAVRGFALMLGIVFHAAISFIPETGWMIKDTQPSVTMSVVFAVIHIFRMSTFFLVAGFFARMSFHRKGGRAFFADRRKRILYPLLIGWPVMLTCFAILSVWGQITMHGLESILPANGAPPAPPPTPAPEGPRPLIPFPLTHLWFLYVLLLLYGAAIGLRRVVVLIDPKERLRRGVDRLVRFLAGNPVGMVLLAAPLGLVFYFQPQWKMSFGIPTPDNSLIPNLPAIVGYGVAFGFGWLLHRQTGLLQIWRRRWPLDMALAVLLTGICLVLLSDKPIITGLTPERIKLTYAAAYALAIWAWTFGLIGMALRFLSDHSPIRRYIADASYWLYLIHLPLVVALQIVVSQWDIHWALKLAVILGVSFPLMFVSYHYMVRYTFIGETLNGRRQPKG